MNLFRNFSIKTRLIAAFLLVCFVHLTVFGYIIFSHKEISNHTLVFISIITLIVSFIIASITASSIISPIYIIINCLQAFQAKKSQNALKDTGDDEITNVAIEINRIFDTWNKEIVELDKKQLLQEQESEKKNDQITSTELQLEQTRSLLTVAQKLNTTFDFQTNMKMLLDEAVRSMNVQWASILLINRERNDLTVACVRGIEQSLLDTLQEDNYPSIKLKPNEGLAGLVIQGGLPLIANKGSKDIRFKQFTEFEDKYDRIASILCSPIIGTDGTVLGVVNFINRIVPPVFKNEDLSYAKDLCTLASILIERNRLYTNLFVDSETGLSAYNVWKGYFSEESSRALRYAQTMTVVIVEIDDFRNILLETDNNFIKNLLTTCGKNISDALRETDRAAAIQERFYCMLPNTDTAGGVFFAGRVKESIESQVFTFNKKSYKVTISVGISCYPYSAENGNDLLKTALQALSDAKDSGGNRAVVAETKK